MAARAATIMMSFGASSGLPPAFLFPGDREVVGHLAGARNGQR